MTASQSDDLKYWVAFSRIPRIGAVRGGLLESHFGTMEAAWHATGAELGSAGLDRGTVTSIVESRLKIDPDDELEKLRKAGVGAYPWTDPSYPARLKEIDDRPPVLYVRGELRPEDEWAVAIVGTRRATPYG